MSVKGTNHIAWTVKDRIAYFNISLLALQQLQNAHELTIVLAGLVKFLGMGVKAAYGLLSALATPHALQIARLHKCTYCNLDNKRNSFKDRRS